MEGFAIGLIIFFASLISIATSDRRERKAYQKKIRDKNKQKLKARKLKYRLAKYDSKERKMNQTNREKIWLIHQKNQFTLDTRKQREQDRRNRKNLRKGSKAKKDPSLLTCIIVIIKKVFF